MDSGNFNNIYNNPNSPYYGPQGPVRPPESAPHGLSIASLVLGIIGIVLCCIFYLAIIFGVIGLILGIAGYAVRKTKFGIAAIIVSSVALGLGIFYILALMFIAISDRYYLGYSRHIAESLSYAFAIHL